MQRETGELSNFADIEAMIGDGKAKKEDYIDTGLTEGMEVAIGNIRCTVRKITRKDIILRPIPMGKETAAQARQRAIDEAVADNQGGPS